MDGFFFKVRVIISASREPTMMMQIRKEKGENTQAPHSLRCVIENSQLVHNDENIQSVKVNPFHALFIILSAYNGWVWEQFYLSI